MKNIAVYQQDDKTGEQLLINLFETDAFIGSSNRADIVINDIRCSGIHAYINYNKEEKTFSVLDLGSGSNTFYKGKTQKEFSIKSGEVFSVGTTNLLIKAIPPVMMEFQSFLPDKVITEEVKEVTTEEHTFISDRNLLQVSFYWGQQLLESRTFSSGSHVSIGSARKDTFAVTLPEKRSSHKLATYKNESLLLTLPESASGLFWQGEDTFTLKDIKKLRPESFNEVTGETKVELRQGDRAEIQFGEQTLSFNFVVPAEKLRRHIPISIDRNLLKIYAGVASAFILFALLSLITPETRMEPKVPEKLKKVLYEAGIKSAKKKQKSAIGEIIAQGGRAKGKSGMAKRRKAENEKKKKKKTSPKVVAEKKTSPATQEKAKKVATEVEKLPDAAKAFSSATDQTVLDEVVTKGPTEEGNTVSAVTSGTFARGNTGQGAGGGGESVGIGTLKGLSTGGGMGVGDSGIEASKGKSIDVEEVEEIEYRDSLDSDIISAIIKRYLPQIDHCYEAQLVHRPNIKGKVVVGFTINSKGLVDSPKIIETTLKDTPTEKCILSKVRKWKFPMPKGGGTAKVNYPFLLMSTK